MTQHELFEKTFSALHASPDTILEVKRTMQNEKKTRRILGRGAVIAIAAALTLSVAVAAGVVLIRADVSPCRQGGRHHLSRLYRRYGRLHPHGRGQLR